MGTTYPVGQVATTDALAATKFAKNVLVDKVLKNPLIKILREDGCINMHADLSTSGGTVKVSNSNRLNSVGSLGDVSAYANPVSLEFGQREIAIGRGHLTVQIPDTGTLTSQVLPFDPKGEFQKLASDWMSQMSTYDAMFQLTG